jgi:hypothetical protein
MKRLAADGRAIASHFGLQYRAIEAERANVKSRYGICYDDGTIKIRLAHVVSGRPLKYSSLVSTLCHELAHLRHFDHGPKFRAFNLELLAWARGRAIYQPGQGANPSAGAVPAQLDLREAIRSGRLPTLRESLAGVLRSPSELAGSPSTATRPSVHGAPADPTPSPRRATHAAVDEAPAPSQLELFA